ncbi:hypothetical protein, partial [Pseudomonas lundensis]
GGVFYRKSYFLGLRTEPNNTVVNVANDLVYIVCNNRAKLQLHDAIKVRGARGAAKRHQI